MTDNLFNNPPQSTLNELRFSALVSATSDVLFRADADWKTIQPFIQHKVDGKSEENQQISEWMEKYVFPDDRNMVGDTIKLAIENKRKYELEHRVVLADGTTGWILARAVPILDDRGEILEWFGSTTDTTASRKNKDELRAAYQYSDKQKRVYEAITRNTPDLMYVFDLDYRFTYANEALLEMWGKSWNEAIGRGLIENGYEPWHARKGN